MADRLDNRPLGELLSELSRETSTLVRKEIELATTETSAKLKVAAAHVGMAAAGGALIHAGLLVLLAAVVVGLAQLGVTAWLSALIVGAVTIGVGYLMVNNGLGNLRTSRVAPTQTIESMKETARWTTGQKT